MQPQTLGRYEVIRPIASGGMATVYLGRALGLGGFQRLVAIKVMHPQFAAETEFVSMFMDEARLAASIRHPNVVGTLDIEQGPEGLFLVMEYVEGVALNGLLRMARQNNARLPVAITLRIFLDTLAGLHAAHELVGTDGAQLNLVHRDVSPHNVLIGVDGIARITDFGVARAEARIFTTREGSVKGKLPYMAPEQLRGAKVDRRADVYSCGVVLWEMLTGERLVQGDDQGQLLSCALRGPRAAVRQIEPAVPQAVDDACMRALEALEDRYPTTAAFADALELAAAEAGVAIANARIVGGLVKAASPVQMPLPPPSNAGYGTDPRAISASTPHAIRSMPGQAVAGSSLTGSARPAESTATGVITSSAGVNGASSRRWPQFVLLGVSCAAMIGAAGWFVAHSNSGASTAADAPKPSDQAPASRPTYAPEATTAAAPAAPKTGATAAASATASAHAEPEPVASAHAAPIVKGGGGRVAAPGNRSAAPAAAAQGQSPHSFHPDTP